MDADSYLLTLIRYIHLNPVRAALVSSPVAYPWSSHGTYIDARNQPWVTTRTALRLLSPDPTAARPRSLLEFIDSSKFYAGAKATCSQIQIISKFLVMKNS